MYKRVLLKLSGEQLQGKYDGGFDAERAAWIAKEIKKAKTDGPQIFVMTSGGVGRVTLNNIVNAISGKLVGTTTT